MQILKKVSLMLLMTCLSGCSNIAIRDLPQLNIRLVFDFDPVSGRRYLNEKDSVCFVRSYRHSKEFIGPINKNKEIPLMDCNKMTGYAPSDYVDLSVFKEEVRLEFIKWYNSTLIELNK